MEVNTSGDEFGGVRKQIQTIDIRPSHSVEK